MTVVTRFVVRVDLDDMNTSAREMSVSARLTAELGDGRSLTLLDDRGWSSTLHGRGVGEPADIRGWVSAEDVETTARMVVGPDEPFDGQTQEEATAGHWAALAGILRQRGVDADASELARLPHDVEFSQRLRAWLLPPG